MLCYALISVTVRLEGGRGTFVNAEYRFADFWSRSNLLCMCVCVCVCVCVCLCALSLSFVYSMWGSDKQNGEMAHCISGLAANLR